METAATSLDPRGSYRLLARSVNVLERRFEAVAANLANTETSGFKRILTQSEFQRRSQTRAGSDLRARTYRDFRQGPLVDTGNRHDLALEGEGFLALEQDGAVRYTRSVTLHVSPEGFLLDQRGLRLLGSGGPIRLPDPSAKLEISPDGTIESDAAVRGSLQIVRFADPAALADAGPGLFAAPATLDPEPAEGTEIRAGHRERSNVDALNEMVEMASIHRQFEAAQRAIRAHSELRSRLFQSTR